MSTATNSYFKTVFIALALLCFSGGMLRAQAPLYLISQFFEDQEITAFCEWKGNKWISTHEGLFRYTNREFEQIAVPPVEGDRITSLYNGSPYALVCGTYNGDIIFITKDESDFCQAVWQLCKNRSKPMFYISSISQTDKGLWVGTFEKGALLVNPDTREFEQFSLDFNQDSLGLNVYQIYRDKKDVIWANTQDGLYFILKIYGDIPKLQYVRSRKFKKPPVYFNEVGEDQYLIAKRWGKFKMYRAEFSEKLFDLKIKKRFQLPEEFHSTAPVAASINSHNDFWVLGDKLYHSRDEDYRSYELPEEVYFNDLVGMMAEDSFVWLASRKKGLYRLSLKPVKENVLAEAKKLFAVNQFAEIEDIFFGQGDTLLRTRSFIQLEALSTILSQDTSLTLTIYGHTAMDGDSVFLHKLSLGRARSVAAFFESRGIVSSRLKCVGKGASDLKDNRKPQSAENRRVELQLIRQ